MTCPSCNQTPCVEAPAARDAEIHRLNGLVKQLSADLAAGAAAKREMVERLTRERDEARADLAALRRQVEDDPARRLLALVMSGDATTVSFQRSVGGGLAVLWVDQDEYVEPDPYAAARAALEAMEK